MSFGRSRRHRNRAGSANHVRNFQLQAGCIDFGASGSNRIPATVAGRRKLICITPTTDPGASVAEITSKDVGAPKAAEEHGDRQGRRTRLVLRSNHSDLIPARSPGTARENRHYGFCFGRILGRIYAAVLIQGETEAGCIIIEDLRLRRPEQESGSVDRSAWSDDLQMGRILPASSEGNDCVDLCGSEIKNRSGDAVELHGVAVQGFREYAIGDLAAYGRCRADAVAV